jgi:hypothetical protein
MAESTQAKEIGKLVVFSSLRSQFLFETKGDKLLLREGVAVRGNVAVEYTDGTVFVTIEDETVPYNVRGTVEVTCEQALKLLDDPLNLWLTLQDQIDSDPESISFEYWQIHEKGGYGTLQDVIKQVKAELKEVGE